MGYGGGGLTRPPSSVRRVSFDNWLPPPAAPPMLAGRLADSRLVGVVVTSMAVDEVGMGVTSVMATV